MNTYHTTFSVACPVNGDYVHYSLCIETTAVIPAEDLSAACERFDHHLHEQIADALVDRFRGKQTLSANHRGVDITTTRIK